MFYIQTQDGDLPYIYKVFETQKGAEKAAFKFMRENHERGAFAVCDAFHKAVRRFHRNTPSAFFFEEIVDDETFEVVDTIEHH